MKRISILLTVAAAAVWACSAEKDAPVIAAESVSIEQGDLSLKVGQTAGLSATVLPDNTTDKTVLWASSDEDVVMVSRDGKALAISAGEVEISAEIGGKSDFITIVVTEEASGTGESRAETAGAEKITAVSAVLKGRARPESGAVEVGFQYSKSAVMLPFEAVTVAAAAPDASNGFEAAAVPLEPDTKYYYRSVFKQGEKEYYGAVKEFTTKALSTLFGTGNAPEETIDCRHAVLHADLDPADLSYTDIIFGFLWGTSEDALDKTIVVGGGAEMPAVIGSRTFSYDLTGLTYLAEYWYRAFLKIDGRYYYGNLKSFETPDYTIGPIDLGLSVKWADGNLGATTPDAAGDYYAWGEVETYYSSLNPLKWKSGKKNGYTTDSYRWYGSSSTSVLKYNAFPDYPPYAPSSVHDDKIVLDPEDDAARVILGGDWRMPTYEEMSELVTSCDWKWTVTDLTGGYTVTGPNGNSIFLPAAGTFNNKDLWLARSKGAYWTTALCSPEVMEEWEPQRALHLLFYSNYISSEILDANESRTQGLSIRAVIDY